MIEFSYKAFSKSGAVVSSTLTARSKSEATSTLKDQGLAPFELTAIQKSGSGAGKLRIADLAIFCSQMAEMCASDLPVEEALEIIAGEGKSPSGRFAAELRGYIIEGRSLTEALQATNPDLPSILPGLVAAGEETSDLATVFQRLADEFETRNRLAESIRGALLYPAILVVTAIAALLLVLLIVTPSLAPIFESAPERAPFAARMLVSVSESLQAYGVFLLAGLLIAAALVVRHARTPEGARQMDALLIRIPVLQGVVLDTEYGRVAATLSALSASGVSMVQALAIARQSAANRLVARELEGVVGNVREGAQLSAALGQCDLAPALLVRLARAGDRTGAMHRLLGQAARLLEQRANRRTQLLLTIAAPAITIGLGLLVGGVVLTLLSAIMSVNDLAISGAL